MLMTDKILSYFSRAFLANFKFYKIFRVVMILAKFNIKSSSPAGSSFCKENELSLYGHQEFWEGAKFTTFKNNKK